MPGIKEKLKAANKKRKAKKTIRKAKKNTTVNPYIKSIASRTQDPVKGGSGSITKTTTRQKVDGALQKPYSTRVKKKIQSAGKTTKKIVDSVMGYSKGGMLKKSSSSRMYNKGGFIQHD